MLGNHLGLPESTLGLTAISQSITKTFDFKHTWKETQNPHEFVVVSRLLLFGFTLMSGAEIGSGEDKLN